MIASVAITAVAFYGAGEIIAVMQDNLLEGVYSCGEAVADYPTVSAATAAGVHAGAGAIAGGLSSAINHGNVGLGMLTGAISAGVAKFAGSFIDNEALGYQFVGRSAIGATTGGITSSIYGGNFGKGFVRGGEIAALAVIFNDMLHWNEEALQRLREGRGDMLKGFACGLLSTVPVLGEGIVRSGIDALRTWGEENLGLGFLMGRYLKAVDVFNNVTGDMKQTGIKVGGASKSLMEWCQRQ